MEIPEVTAVGNSRPTTIGKIQRVLLREVWKHEAHDFTTWLQENIDALNEAIDLTLSSAEREQTAGDFSVDLVAEDEDGNPVVIENQLEKSNHDHLGKLLTYLVAIGAKTAIWIVSDPRPEHVNTISWLNESSPASFFLLKLEAIRIGGSPVAPLLTLVVGPSEESRGVGETKKEWAERDTLRYRFWEGLLERVRTKTKLHANISPSRGTWISTGAGKSGLVYSYIIREHGARAELSIDRGKGAEEENKAIFAKLLASRENIEERFGGSVVWDSVEGRRVCRIAAEISEGGYRDEEDRWPEIHDAMIESMVRLEKALSPHISKLQI
jgi:hypothetical protein